MKIISTSKSLFILFRLACSIPTDEDTVIITGGKQHPSIVSEYNIKGLVREMTNLKTGRYDHACGQYENENGEKVLSSL